MDVESDNIDLKRRIGDLEGADEKLGSVHPEIVALSPATGKRFEREEQAAGHTSEHLDDVSGPVWSLRDDFPELLG